MLSLSLWASRTFPHELNHLHQWLSCQWAGFCTAVCYLDVPLVTTKKLAIFQ